MPLDHNGNSTNDPNGSLIAGNDQAKVSVDPISAAHASTKEKARQGRKATNAGVTGEQGDDDADAKV